jgi:O-glycosyl hydrolase
MSIRLGYLIYETFADSLTHLFAGSGWEEQRARLTGIQRYHQEKNLGLVTSHGYSSYPGAPFDTSLHVWQTEWSTFDDINYNWYTPGGSESDGITWANNIRNTFVNSNVNGFLYWWGAAEKTDNEMLIFINHTNIVRPLKRLYAHAHFGKKFVRQGAIRIEATSSQLLNVSAFENTDGSTAVQVINNSNKTENVVLDYNVPHGYHVEAYLTNEQYDLEAIEVKSKGRKVDAKVPGQSLLSFYIAE